MRSGLMIVTMMPPTMFPVFVELITIRGMITPMWFHDDRRHWMPKRAVGDSVYRGGRIHHTRVHNARGRLHNHAYI